MQYHEHHARESCVFFQRCALWALGLLVASDSVGLGADVAKRIGLKTPPPQGVEVLVDGTRKTLDSQWTYWEGPRFSSSLPIKWQLI